MKGSEYEQFVFEKFSQLFADSTVTKNDHIRGHLSGLDREIDVSVRLIADDAHLLYIAQCKDWKIPTDIKVLGEFSAVIQDVKAAKGFLLCTSGFAKSNHQYALTLGIELVTIEDIASDKWHTTVQIPFVYIKKNIHFNVNILFAANRQLVEKNRDRELVVELSMNTSLSEDEGETKVSVQEFIDSRFQEIGSTFMINIENDVLRPNLQIQIADVWVPCTEFSFTVTSVSKSYYLKYLTPDEYSHLRDHVRGTTLPLHVKLQNVGIKFDDTFVELPSETPPVFPGLFLQVEEWTHAEQMHSTASPQVTGAAKN
jgi:hypothetical protein